MRVVCGKGKKKSQSSPNWSHFSAASAQGLLIWTFEPTFHRSLIDVEACIFFAWFFEKKIQATEKKIQVVKKKDGQRKTAWRVERQADINGIISLIRNEGYFTSAPWRVYTFSPRRMRIWSLWRILDAFCSLSTISYYSRNKLS